MAATIAAALAAVAAVLLWRTEVPPDLVLPPLSPESEFGGDIVRETAGYARVARALWLASAAAGLAALCAFAWWAPRVAARLRGSRLARSAALLLAALVVLWLARLPAGAAAHWWRRRHGLSRQGYVDWLVDPWPELLATVAVAAVALAVSAALRLRLGPRWWLAGGPALAAVGAAVVLVQPLVEARRLEPLRDAALEREILALAAAVGVPTTAVVVEDASRRTTRVNAEVIGVGATRRVVLWDTLLDGRLTPEEVRFVAAHELAHVGRGHVPKGLAWFALLALPLAFAVARATERHGGVAEPAAVPLAVLAVVALQLALLPVENALSRRYEAEADWVALRATGDPDAARGVFRRFARENLAQPLPPRWARVVLGSHPPLVERAAMAEAFSRGPGRRSPGGS